MRRERNWVLCGLAAAATTLAIAGPVLASEEGKPTLIAPPSAGIVPALTTLVVFVALLAILGKYAWGPIALGLKAREDKIRKDISDAEAARARAEATLRDYNAQLATAEEKVRALIQQAAVDGERIAGQIRTRAQQEAEETKERAMREIEAAKRQALSEIYEQTAELSTQIAEKILRRSLNVDDQRDLVRSSLDQLQTLNRG